MQAIKLEDWQSLPEQAQQEVYHFFLFIQQQYKQQENSLIHDDMETRAFSNHSANLIHEWKDDAEDEIWT